MTRYRSQAPLCTQVAILGVSKNKLIKSTNSGEFSASEHKKPNKDSKTISQSCWPDCAGQSIKIVQVEII